MEKDGIMVVWMGDANRLLEDNKMSKVITKAGLYDIMESRHSPHASKTYIKESKLIYYILGTAEAVETIRRVGMLEFNHRIASN